MLAERETAGRVVQVHGLAIEYVDEPLADREHLRQWWGEWTFVAYTTGFHRQPIEDKPEGPRWRILLPFARPVGFEEAVEVARWVRHPRHNAGTIDIATGSVWRYYAMPALAPGDADCLKNEGEVLDPSMAIEQLNRWEAEDRALAALEVLEDASLTVGVAALKARLQSPRRKTRCALPGDLPDLWPGRLALLVGRTGHARTAFALHVAHQAASAGNPVLFVAVGTGADELVARLLCLGGLASSWVDLLHEGAVELDDACVELEQRCPGLSLWLPDQAQRTDDALRAKVQAMVEAQGGRAPLVVLDAVETWAAGASGDAALRQVAGVLCDVVHATVDWPGAAVLAVRGVGPSEAASFATVEALQSSRASIAERSVLEQDAALVLALSLDNRAGKVSVAVLKNRHGGTGVQTLAFDPASGRFG